MWHGQVVAWTHAWTHAWLGVMGNSVARGQVKLPQAGTWTDLLNYRPALQPSAAMPGHRLREEGGGVGCMKMPSDKSCMAIRSDHSRPVVWSSVVSINRVQGVALTAETVRIR